MTIWDSNGILNLLLVARPCPRMMDIAYSQAVSNVTWPMMDDHPLPVRVTNYSLSQCHSYCDHSSIGPAASLNINDYQYIVWFTHALTLPSPYSGDSRWYELEGQWVACLAVNAPALDYAVCLFIDYRSNWYTPSTDANKTFKTFLFAEFLWLFFTVSLM